MNRNEFEALTGLGKAEFINKELNEGRTLEDIARTELNMSRSWVEKQLYKEGYKKERNSVFVFDEKEHVPEVTEDLSDLLKHAYTLVSLAKRIEAENSIKPDFTVLQQYKESVDHRFTITMKKELHEQLKNLAETSGINISKMISLAVHHLIQSYN